MYLLIASFPRQKTPPPLFSLAACLLTSTYRQVHRLDVRPANVLNSLLHRNPTIGIDLFQIYNSLSCRPDVHRAQTSTTDWLTDGQTDGAGVARKDPGPGSGRTPLPASHRALPTSLHPWCAAPAAPRGTGCACTAWALAPGGLQKEGQGLGRTPEGDYILVSRGPVLLLPSTMDTGSQAAR